MTLLTNSFESGTSGTTVSPANSGNPSAPFDTIFTGSGVTAAYDTAHAAHGSQAVKIATGTTATSVYLQWDASIPAWAATMYVRIYAYFTANPSANLDLVTFLDASASRCGKFRIGTGGKISLLDSSQANQGLSANTIPLNAWFRLDGWITGSATAGQLQVSLFTGSGGDSTTALETVTSPATINTNGTPGQCRFGHSGTGAAGLGPFWLDDAALSDKGTLIGWADYLSTGTGTQDTGSGTDGGTGPSGGTHEEVGVTNAGG